MSDLVAIVRATRASANALAAMARHARAAADASDVLMRLARLEGSGRISAETASLGRAIAQRHKTQAIANHERARRGYDRAQITLARNPL
jgi:hypothetical protein